MTFVKLQYLDKRLEGKKLVCSSIAKAVDALDALGFCMNWATLVKIQRMPVLIYQGWIFRNSMERFVELPFSSLGPKFPDRFKDLLFSIFNPFIRRDDYRLSSIDYMPYPKTNDCDDHFVFNLTLFIRGKKRYKMIYKALQEVQDGEDAINGTVHWLD